MRQQPYLENKRRKLQEVSLHFFIRQVTFHQPNYQKKIHLLSKYVCAWHLKILFIACITPEARKQSTSFLFIWKLIVCQLKCNKKNMVWNFAACQPNSVLSFHNITTMWKMVGLYFEVLYKTLHPRNMSFSSQRWYLTFSLWYLLLDVKDHNMPEYATKQCFSQRLCAWL